MAGFVVKFLAQLVLGFNSKHQTFEHQTHRQLRNIYLCPVNATFRLPDLAIPKTFGVCGTMPGMDQPKRSKRAAWIEITGAPTTKHRYARLKIAGGKTLLNLSRVDDHPCGLLDAVLEAAPTATLEELYALRDADKRARWPQDLDADRDIWFRINLPLSQ